MGLYIQAEAVTLRLIGKVQFTTDLNDENKMPMALLNRLINEAEAQVEFDLSPRYMAPLQTDGGQPFSLLPTRPTAEFLRTLCELKAVTRVLQTDFGRGSAVNGDEYYKSIESQYNKMTKQQLAKDPSGKFVYPPLPSLKLNYMNSAADDGFSGMVLTHSSDAGAADFAERHINNPSETFWNPGRG
jgi:hypothetical protein